MITRYLIVGLTLLAALSCARGHNQSPNNEMEAPRIVSLDYCADQYVLKLVERSQIAGLSPDADASFSYMRDEAKGLRQVRPRAEDILILKPDIVVRSYGGGPNITGFLDRVGIKVIQLSYAADLKSVEDIILETATQLGADKSGETLVQEMQDRLTSLPETTRKSVLYMTSRGAAAGKNTLVNDLMLHAGVENFDKRAGWGLLPLEALAYQRPDVIAAAYFETSELVSDIWTPSRHPVAKRVVATTPVIEIPGAVTACGGWFLIDAVEAIAQAATE